MPLAIVKTTKCLIQGGGDPGALLHRKDPVGRLELQQRRLRDGRGIFAMDCEGDCLQILQFGLEGGLRFVIGQRGDRQLLMSTGRKRRVSPVPYWGRARGRHTVEIERNGDPEHLSLTLRVLPRRLPRCPDTRVWLVEIQGFGARAILLLSNVPSRESRSYAEWVNDIFLTR